MNKDTKKLLKDMGFGISLFGQSVPPGEFREKILGLGLDAPSIFVKYEFITAFNLPIWPLKCYWIKEVQDGFIGRKHIKCEEAEPRMGEIINIYICHGLVGLPFQLYWPLQAIMAISEYIQRKRL